MMGPVYRWLSPAGDRAALSVFIFHRVLPEPDPLMPWEPDVIHFDRICRFLARNYRVLDLAEAIRLRDEGLLPAAAAAITFDDGYADNADCALPVLQRNKLNATFFISTGFTAGGRMWNDDVIEAVRHVKGTSLDLEPLGLGRFELGSVQARIAAYQALIGKVKYLSFDERSEMAQEIAAAAKLPEGKALMMDADRICRLRDAGMGIGGHTVNHPILAQLPDQRAREEIAQGRRDLQAMTGCEIPLFAYPNGKPEEDYLPRHAAMIKEAGFVAAMTTQHGVAGPGQSRWELPRYTPWERDLPRFALRCARNMRMRRSSPA